jgi:hypothetical protein
VNQRVTALLGRLGLEGEALTLRMTGCPNGCARPYMAEIGFVGDGPNSYQVRGWWEVVGWHRTHFLLGLGVGARFAGTGMWAPARPRSPCPGLLRLIVTLMWARESDNARLSFDP